MHPLLRLAAPALAILLAACGGGDPVADASAGTNAGGNTSNAGGNTSNASGGGTSADGPTLDTALLARLCPVFDAASKTYSHCKSGNDAAVNALLIDVNIWLSKNSPTKQVSASPAPDASYGVAVGDACDFSFEPGLGIWMTTQKGAPGPSIQWTGTAFDAVQLNSAGVVIYMSGSKDDTGAGFVNATGQIEINFPGVTQGTATEVVYGHDGLFLSCKMK